MKHDSNNKSINSINVISDPFINVKKGITICNLSLLGLHQIDPHGRQLPENSYFEFKNST